MTEVYSISLWEFIAIILLALAWLLLEVSYHRNASKKQGEKK